MKEVFFEQLKSELQKLNLDEKKIKSIIDDYERTFDLGTSAGLSDAEVIAKLGNPKSIANEYKGHQKSIFEDREYDENDRKIVLSVKDNYNIKLSLISGTIKIDYHDGDKIVVYTDVENDECWKATVSDNTFKLWNDKKATFIFRSKRKGNFQIYLPRNLNIDKFEINDINSKISSDSIDASDIDINTVNGTFNVPFLKGSTVCVNSVNGRIAIDDINGGSINIESVNAKFDINTVLAKRCDVSNVSGVIRIGRVDKEIFKQSNVVGKIVINE